MMNISGRGKIHFFNSRSSSLIHQTQNQNAAAFFLRQNLIFIEKLHVIC